MAGVEGIAFTSGSLPLPANKENGGFGWQDPAGSTDFFDQYVELGDSDSESPGGGGSRFGQLCGASEQTTSPQPSVGQMPPPSGTGRMAGGVPNPQSGLLSAATIYSGAGTASLSAHSAPSTVRFPRPRPELHSFYRGTQTMVGYSNPDIEVEGVPAPAGFGEPRSGGGSISDSELLKLEGLTMRSPRVQIPQPSASEPASPPSQSTSPRKAGRLQEFCARIRNKAAALHGKRQQPKAKLEPDPQASVSVSIMSTAQMEPVKARPWPYNPSVSKPLTSPPPPTGAIPGTGTSQRPIPGTNISDSAGFVNGFLEDPFLHDGLPGGQFVPPFQLSGSMPHTPLQTPLLDGVPAWQLPLCRANDKPLWPSAGPGAYFPVVNGDAAAATTNGWWDPSADAMDTDPPHPLPVPLSYSAAANARNATLNLAIQLDQHQTGFEYPAPPGTDDGSFASSGLMIHMPQSRAAAPVVLHSDRPTRADHQHRRPKPRAPSSGARHQHYNATGTGASPRKTRAASGSSRGVSPPSPNTPVTAAAAAAARISSSGSGSASAAGLHRRSASMQTLAQTAPSDLASTGTGATTPSAIRKRRSWTGRRTSSSSSAALLHRHHSHGNLASSTSASSLRKQARAAAAAAASSSSSPSTTTTPNAKRSQPSTNNSSNNKNKTKTSENAGGYHTAAAPVAAPAPAQDGFVNYTPQDRALLMTGVAPSGSSKTKARREREAAERQREFRDRLARMVRAAGGDVSKLSGELDGVAVGDIGVGDIGGDIGGGIGGGLGGVGGIGMGIVGGVGGGGGGGDGVGVNVKGEEGPARF